METIFTEISLNVNEMLNLYNFIYDNYHLEELK